MVGIRFPWCECFLVSAALPLRVVGRLKNRPVHLTRRSKDRRLHACRLWRQGLQTWTCSAGRGWRRVVSRKRLQGEIGGVARCEVQKRRQGCRRYRDEFVGFAIDHWRCWPEISEW